MALLDDLRRAARRRLLRSRRYGSRLPHSDLASPVSHQVRSQEIVEPGGEAHGSAGGVAFGFSGVPGEESLGSMSAEDLSAWQNLDVPNIDRVSDDSEARADEKQDVTTSLSFPLHWTSPRESWDYLFDFSLACELLAPRPDDLVLDFAAGTAGRQNFSAASEFAPFPWTYRSR